MSDDRWDGIDADAESWDERSDYTIARRYMNYEVRDEANDQETAWLHAHPVQWLRALRVAKKEAIGHIRRTKIDLRSDPRKPTGNATAETHTAWTVITADTERIQAARRAFVGKVDDRIALVRELLPRDVLPIRRINALVVDLLGIELQLRDGYTEPARRSLAHLILYLATVEDDGTRTDLPSSEHRA